MCCGRQAAATIRLTLDLDGVEDDDGSPLFAGGADVDVDLCRECIAALTGGRSLSGRARVAFV